MIHTEDKRYILFLGDCNKELKRIKSNSVDVVSTDPPYRLSRGGTSCKSGKRVIVNKAAWDKSEGVETDYSFYHKWIGECKRILKPNGAIWIMGSQHCIFLCGHALQVHGFHIINDIVIYHKNPPPNLGCRCFTHSHETLIWAKPHKSAKHTFNYETMKNWKPDLFHNEGKQMKSVWEVGRPTKHEIRFGKHVTQKPVELSDRIVAASSNEGDLILDPFTGSSTTGVSALKMGRRFIGIDITEEDLIISAKRLREV